MLFPTSKQWWYFRDGLDLANRDDKNSLFHPSILWGFLHPKKIIYMVIFLFFFILFTFPKHTHAHRHTLFLINVKSTLLAKYPQSVLPLICPVRIFSTPKTRWGGDEAVEARAPLIQSRPAKLPYGQVCRIYVHFKCLLLSLMICYCWVQVVSICFKGLDFIKVF